jgi:prepilin-type processing-associated H-X9-DG protein
MSALPTDRAAKCLGALVTQFDYAIDDAVAAELQKGGYADYFAWNFKANVWFADGQYHAEIWRYHSHVDTISAPTALELVRECSAKYGTD